MWWRGGGGGISDGRCIEDVWDVMVGEREM